MGSGIVSSGARSRISWPLRLAILLIAVLLLCIAMMPSPDYPQYSPPVTRYNGVKGFVDCPRKTSAVRFHEQSSEASKLNTLSARCAKLARILQTSKHIINQILLVDAEQIDAGTKFADMCDSYDKIEVLTALQKQFNVTFTEDIVTKIATLGDAVGVIEELKFNGGVSTKTA